jgi:hypothetical protein
MPQKRGAVLTNQHQLMLLIDQTSRISRYQHDLEVNVEALNKDKTHSANKSYPNPNDSPHPTPIPTRTTPKSAPLDGSRSYQRALLRLEHGRSTSGLFAMISRIGDGPTGGVREGFLPLISVLLFLLR